MEPYNGAKMAPRLQAARPGTETLLRVDFYAGRNGNHLSKVRSAENYADEYDFVLPRTYGR